MNIQLEDGRYPSSWRGMGARKRGLQDACHRGDFPSRQRLYRPRYERDRLLDRPSGFLFL